jgi:hypothetical protein
MKHESDLTPAEAGKKVVEANNQMLAENKRIHNLGRKYVKENINKNSIDLPPYSEK